MADIHHETTISITIPTRLFNQAEHLAEHMGVNTEYMHGLIYFSGVSAAAKLYGEILHTEDLTFNGSAP